MTVEVKPVRLEADHEAALAEIERLWGAKTGTPEGDRLDVLATLVDAYESDHYPIDPPDPIEAIKFRMEQQDSHDVTWRPCSARARVAEVLNRKRELSIGMIRRLHEQLGISAEVLIRPVRTNATREGGLRCARLQSSCRTIVDRVERRRRALRLGKAI